MFGEITKGEAVSWDLAQEPPASIAGGDGKKLQDGPPVELVLDIGAGPGEAVTLCIDDLEVGLAR